MKFGIDKCATASLTTGRLSVCDNLVVSEDTVIPALNDFDSYRYLGMFELDQCKEKHMKDIIICAYCKRICTFSSQWTEFNFSHQHVDLAPNLLHCWNNKVVIV